MGTGYQTMCAGVAGAMVAAIGASAVSAQEVVPPRPVVQPVIVRVSPVPVPLQQGTIPYEFLDEFYSNDGNYFQNRTFLRQVAYIFGPFTENEIVRDAREVDQLYQEVLSRQLSTGVIIRTADLPNPFQQTIGTLPRAEADVPPLPVQPPVIQPQVTPPEVIVPPEAAPADPTAPVPGLW